MRKVAGYSLWLGHAGDVRDPAGLLAAGVQAVVSVTAKSSRSPCHVSSSIAASP